MRNNILNILNECKPDDVLGVEVSKNMVNKIFDHFESRVCKNCKHYRYIGKTFKRCNSLKMTIADDWYCGDFIHKNNSGDF